VVPALAVGAELRARGAEVSFAGTRERAEAKLVPEAGFEIDFLDVAGLDRRNPLKAARAAWRAAAAIPAARRLLRERGADVVMGGGGYVAGPVGLAATRLGLPLVLTEADSHLGLANRLLAGRARRVCLAFPIEGREGERYLVTGRPVPPEVGASDRPASRTRFGIPPDARCVLIFGGSLGARSINLAALEAFAEAPGERRFWVLHVCGSRDHAEIVDRLTRAPNREGYVLIEYLQGMADAYAAGDLVVARSGGSVFELAAAGKPAVLVPYPHATGDHQTHNARWMAEAGAAVAIPNDELDASRLAQAVEELIHDEERLGEMERASRSLARPDAAARIAEEILAAAEAGGR
jgi:UDP-N-acetylglucosamine--N-acetylmuramyl-(pentapeptide) pyrophosphoryl-undecaprenol N-acetylglucosamine transferase